MACSRFASLPGALALVVLAACSGDDDAGGVGPAGIPAVPDLEHGPSVAGDIDGDGRADARDVCPSIANRDQRRACEYPAPPLPTGDVVRDGVAHLSWTRSLVGLGPVVDDPELTHGCEIHLAYLRRRSMELDTPILEHEEDLSLSYASEEGNRAGIDSVLSLGRESIAEAIDGWMGTLYHRLPLLHPGLARVGVAAGDGYACVQYRPGTDESVPAPFPILWPPPDIGATDRGFPGDEVPCPTIDDPFADAACPGSAAIASIGLNGMGSLQNVSASLARLDSGATVPLFRVYYDGGPTEHEQSGYLDGTVALVPEPGTLLDRAAVYEVTVDTQLAGTPRTFRWRFATGRPLPADVACDDSHSDFETALPIASGEAVGRVCERSQFYRIEGSGQHVVSIELDSMAGDLDLAAYDGAFAEIAKSDGTDDHETVVVPAGSIVEVLGFDGAMGVYRLTVQ